MKPTLRGPQKQMIVLLIGFVRMKVTKGGVRAPGYLADVVLYISVAHVAALGNMHNLREVGNA